MGQTLKLMRVQHIKANYELHKLQRNTHKLGT